MSSVLYKDLDDLVMDNRMIIQDISAVLGYKDQEGKTQYQDVKGMFIKQWDLLDQYIGNSSSFTFRGTCKIGFIFDIEIKNYYVDKERYLKLYLKKNFFANKDMLREIIFNEKLGKAFPSIPSAIARAYLQLSKRCHSSEDLTPIRAKIESFPEWSKSATFGGVRVKSDPWEVIRLALDKMNNYESE